MGYSGSGRDVSPKMNSDSSVLLICAIYSLTLRVTLTFSLSYLSRVSYTPPSTAMRGTTFLIPSSEIWPSYNAIVPSTVN